MNIHKYLLPATVAATVHVALLWFLPEEPHTRAIAVPLPADPGPEKPVEEVRPPEDPVASTEPVKSLTGGPAPIELDEPLIAPLKDTITITVDEPITKPDRELRIAPKTFGPGDISGIGEVGLSGPGIFTIGKLDRVPRAKVQIPPDYPYAMKQSGANGSVVVEFDVDTTGAVVRAEAISYTDREFVEPAVRAVRKWRFEPGRRNGKAVPFRMTVPIEFGIENN